MRTRSWDTCEICTQLAEVEHGYQKFGWPENDVDLPGADMASSEGDTVSFVEFVQDEGGSLLINAEPDGERVYSRPSIMMVRSAEPFFEWAIPLSDSYEYSIGDRPVTGYELFEYISSQGLVRVDVVCDDGRIVSISCWEE